MSDGDRNRRLEQMFHNALEQPEHYRHEWLKAACGDDAQLHAQLERMLDLDPGENTDYAELDDPLARAVHEGVRIMGYAPSQGMRLGAWEIGDELGAGGMGTVFLAERADGEYEGQAAIKVIRGLPDSAGLERLRRERQILAGLHHPNIARLLDGGTTEDGQPFLVMQFIDGRPVDQWCREHVCTPARIVRLLLPVIDAVEYAHRHLVIHRDIKPSNVLVTDDGHPILVDFGIARLLESEHDGSETATVGAIFHTPGFASPEQIAGEHVTTASDIYSLGRVLAELMEAVTEPVPRELAAIIECATREEPEQRYSGTTAFRADLEAWLDGRPVAAVSGRMAYHLRKFLARNRYAAAAVAVGLAVALVLLAQLVQENRRARTAEAQARIEAANAEQVLEFLTYAIEAVQPGRAQGRDVTMREVIERAEQQLSAEQILEPRLRMRILSALGTLYQTLEENDKAAELLARAGELARDTGDIDAEILARALLGISQLRAGWLDAAGQTLERAIALAGQHQELPPLVRADAWNSFGVWATEMDHIESARDALQHALALRREAGAAAEVIASTLHNLALVERRAGRIEPALALFAQALDLKNESIGRLHPSYIRSLDTRAVTLRQLGRYAEATDHATEALEIRKQLYGPEHPGLHASYNELANAHHDLGEFELAISLYRKALELDMRSTSRRSDWIYRNNLGAAFEDRGELAKAERHYQESIERRRELFGENHSATLRARHNLARVWLADGRVDAARALASEVLELRETELGSEHPDTLRSRMLVTRTALAEMAEDPARLRELGAAVEALQQALSPDSQSVLKARAELGRAWLAAGNFEQARAELEAAASGFRQALTSDHPLAAAIELDLALIDQAESRLERARERLAKNGAIVRQRFSPGSLNVERLDCLEAGEQRDCRLANAR